MFKIDDLVETYGEIRALDGCSFSVAPGRMLGFLGPNGARKTTTMRAVFGLVTPDSGTVTWRESRSGRRNGFGLVTCLYAGGLLRFGARTKLKEAWRSRDL